MCYCRFGQNPAPDGFMCHRLAQRSGITSAMKTYELLRWRTRTNTYVHYIYQLGHSHCRHTLSQFILHPAYTRPTVLLQNSAFPSLRRMTKLTHQNQLLHVSHTYSHLSQQLLKTPRLHSAQGPSLNKRCTHHSESQWPSKPCKSAIAAAQRLD